MISLYGKLARKFKKLYKHEPKNIKISANSATEVMRGMNANFPGFKELFKKHGYYRVSRGLSLTHGKSINQEEVAMNFSDTEWHIMPVAAGCKSGFFSVILGIVLIGACIFFAPAAGGFAAGTLGAATAGGVTAFGIKLGVGLALMGLASVLAPDPNISDYSQREVDKKPSYLFNGPGNYVEPGLTIPVAYGETFIGSIFVSGSMIVTDEAT